MDNLEIPLLIKRCLAHSINITPFQLDTILDQYKIRKIPNNSLSKLNKKDLEKYVQGLYLCGQEMSKDWSKGYDLLKELGFEEVKRTIGHRSFMSLIFKNK